MAGLIPFPTSPWRWQTPTTKEISQDPLQTSAGGEEQREEFLPHTSRLKAKMLQNYGL